MRFKKEKVRKGRKELDGWYNGIVWVYLHPSKTQWWFCLGLFETSVWVSIYF